MDERKIGTGCPLRLWIIAGIVGFVVLLILKIGAYSWLAAIFLGVVTTVLVGLVLCWLICCPKRHVRTAPATEPVDPVAIMEGRVEETRVETPAVVEPVIEPTPAKAEAPAPEVPVSEPEPEVEAAEAPVEAPKPAAAPAPAPVATPDPAPAAEPGEGVRPEGLTEAREGGPDDLKKIKGVGPKLEQLLHSMGYFHFDQIAAWTETEVAWVDQNLKGFKGRVTRDEWVSQARLLAEGGETEFSKRVDGGDVY